MKRIFASNRRIAGGIGLAAGALLLSMSAAFAAPLPLKICNVDDKSGTAADTGIESANGLQLAVEPANAAGGVNGQKIEVVSYDSKTDPQAAATFATRCAEDDNALIIIGGNPTAVAAAMVPVANQNKIPYIILSGSQDNLTDNPEYQFRLGAKTAQDGIAVTNSLKQAGFKRVAIVNNSVPFGINGAKTLTEALKAAGIEIVTQQTYDIAATDVSPQIINVVQAKPDVVVVFPYPADGARVVRTIKQLGITAPVIVPRVGLIKTFRELAAADGNGVLVPTSVDIRRDDVKKFFEVYGKKFGPLAPSPYAAVGYDGGNIAIRAFKDPKVQEAIQAGDLAAARTAIRDSIAASGGYEGLQGEAGNKYVFGKGDHHGPEDTGFFVFAEVAENGKQLVAPDMDKLKAMAGK
ncbi:MAG: ABC transporter substrate-binding protein [Flavobacteriaceae bacterium]